MLETLTRGFREARDQLRGTTRLSEENIAEALRAIRLSLLEADVDLTIVRGFLERVRERCEGAEVTLRAGKRSRRVRSSPGDHFTKACYDELVELMGRPEPLAPASTTRVIMLLGLQGTGKTSTAAKLALHLVRTGERPLLVAADVRRPAARDQLRTLGEQIGVPVFAREGTDAAEICSEALVQARADGMTSVILDTAGRLQIDEPLMQELREIFERSRPERTLLVCDAMMGREAVNVAQGFAERLRIDGLILTKLDGDARGGAALAIRSATGVPIQFLTTGEATDRIELFRPEGLASRILGMGDVVGLMQDFEQVLDEDRAEQEAQRLLEGRFTLDDFLSQLRMLKRAGPLKELVEKLPFAGELIPEGAQIDGGELKPIEAMITSMTPLERAQPERIDASRRARIARGSGTQPEDLSAMLQRFDAMRKMMGQLGQGGGLLSKVPGLGKLMGGGLPDLDPAALAGLGAGTIAGGRKTARAQKADLRRKQRRAQRKHKRRGKRR
ncbi:MAG: signal recognition particle protein [Myxococcota bacterium]